MTTEAMAMQAASGLVSLMSGKPVSGAIKDSTVAQVSAAIYYKTSVMSKLTSNIGFQTLFNNTIYNQINKDFGEYIDAKARAGHRSFHHVYEWGRTGDKDARLFKLNKITQNGLSLMINYELLQSKSFVPSSNSKRRHVFINKASIMENGKTVIIAPKYSERLVFDINGYTVFMPKGQSVTITKPGGVATKNSFLTSYKYFFTGQLVNLSIKRSGFQQLFNSKMSRALPVPIQIKRIHYKYSPNSIANDADAALIAAFAGVPNG